MSFLTEKTKFRSKSELPDFCYTPLRMSQSTCRRIFVQKEETLSVHEFIVIYDQEIYFQIKNVSISWQFQNYV